MRNGLASLALLVSATVFAFSVAAAQGPAAAPQAPFAQPPFKNLQVFPKDIGRDELLSSMKFFSRSLGVRCSECHVGVEGQPLSTFDFASDAKSDKRVARKMLAMVHRINREDFGVTDFKDAKVTCFTCHRGSTDPLTEPPAVPMPVPAPASTQVAKPSAERGL